MAFEWNNPSYQHIIAGWSVLSSAAAIDAYAIKLEADPTTRVHGQTGIGDTMRFAARSFANASLCTRQVIDISGDGPGNAGTTPAHIRAIGLLDGLMINGLVIRHPALDSAQPPGKDPLPYYQSHVIQGPGAFVEVIDSYDDYPAAIRRKLLRELSPSLAMLK